MQTIIILLTCFVSASCVPQWKNMVNKATYHREFPPSSNDSKSKLNVMVSIEFINMLEINEVMGELEFSIFYRVSWIEPRLYPFVADPSNPDKPIKIPWHAFAELWRPDIVVENVRGVSRNGIIKPTIYTAVFAPQRPFYSSYIVLRVGCTFEYGSYPMDIQVCEIHVGSMGLTDNILNLGWVPGIAGFKPQSRERFLRFHHLFRLRLCQNTSATLRHSEFGAHPQKTLFIIMQRNFKSIIVQVYMPSTLFVLIAWLSVLVPPTMLRTRLLLNCTNLLTIISMYLSVSKTEATRVPKVSYMTALNLWMFVTVAFCFSSVLLVIVDIRLVVLLTNPGRKLEALVDLFRPKNTAEPGVSSFLEDADEDEEDAEEDAKFTDASDVTPEVSGTALTETQLRSRVAEKRVEWLARTAGFEQAYLVGFPLLFLLFLAGYFGSFLWLRRVKMAHLMAPAESKDALYPGCYCSVHDFGPGCMTEQDYIDHHLVG